MDGYSEQTLEKPVKRQSRRPVRMVWKDKFPDPDEVDPKDLDRLARYYRELVAKHCRA